MAHPTWSFAAAGDVITAATNIAQSGNTQSITQDYSASFAVRWQISAVGVTAMAATNGVQIDVYPVLAGGTVVDTVSVFSIVVPVTSITVATIETIGPFDGFKYQVRALNLDSTNHILVGITSATLTGVA